MPTTTQPARSCATCANACCILFEEVALTRADLSRLEAALGPEAVSASTMSVTLLPPDPTRSPVHVATLGRVVVPGRALGRERTACVFLAEDGCSVYEHRPTVCRTYGVEHCEGVYERDPRKVDGRIRLRVVL